MQLYDDTSFPALLYYFKLETAVCFITLSRQQARKQGKKAFKNIFKKVGLLLIEW